MPCGVLRAAMGKLRQIAKAAARRDASPGRVPDPDKVAVDIAAWIAAQSGAEFIREVPVHLVGCREGIIVAFQAKLGDGFPTWIFQRLDEAFLRRLVDPFVTVYREWVRKKPWLLSFDKGIQRLEKELAGDREAQRIDGVAAVLVDQDTLQPVRTLLVDAAFINTLSHGNPVPAAPLIIAGTGGAGIVLLYQKGPKQNTMRFERIPAEECERLGLDGAEGPPVEDLVAKLVAHVRERLAWPGPEDDTAIKEQEAAEAELQAQMRVDMDAAYEADRAALDFLPD